MKNKDSIYQTLTGLPSTGIPSATKGYINTVTTNGATWNNTMPHYTGTGGAYSEIEELRDEIKAMRIEFEALRQLVKVQRKQLDIEKGSN